MSRILGPETYALDPLLVDPATLWFRNCQKASSSHRPCPADPVQLVKHRLAGHGCWQTGGVEPVAEVPAAGRGGRPGQRGRYGIDGGFAVLAGWRRIPSA